MTEIDLNELANNDNLRLSITSVPEENPIDAKIRRIKDVVLFSITLILVLSAFAFCAFVLFDAQFSPDDKKWATAISSSIISAFIGYLTGRHLN